MSSFLLCWHLCLFLLKAACDVILFWHLITLWTLHGITQILHLFLTDIFCKWIVNFLGNEQCLWCNKNSRFNNFVINITIKILAKMSMIPGDRYCYYFPWNVFKLFVIIWAPRVWNVYSSLVQSLICINCRASF